MEQKVRKTLIRVTQDDIANGICQDPLSCPIARAVRRRYPQASIHVGRIILEIAGNKFQLPDRAIDFIDTFDSGRAATSFHPFNFFIPWYPV